MHLLRIGELSVFFSQQMLIVSPVWELKCSPGVLISRTVRVEESLGSKSLTFYFFGGATKMKDPTISEGSFGRFLSTTGGGW